MSGVLRLAWRHLRYHWGRSLILVACLTMTMLLPLSVQRLVDHYEATLRARAASTPLVVGAKGNRFDLVLKSLYFETGYADRVSMADVDEVDERGFGRAIPVYVRHTAHKHVADGTADDPAFESAPVVGTTLAYLDLRGLEVADGTPPLFLGDAVVGAEAARTLRVAPGDALLSDPLAAYDPARSFQLKMPVVGVLAPSGTPDDRAVFVDLKTAWVIDGIGHGHDDPRTVRDDGVVDRAQSTEDNVVATKKLARYQEITPENRSSFHVHAERADLPVTSLILVPKNDKQRTIALGWYNLHETRQLLEPAAVVEELMGLVFEIKRFFDANFVIVTATTGLLVTLVLLLSYRLRREEMATLAKIGCPRGTAIWLQASELLVLLGASALLAGLGSALALHAAPWFLAALPG